MSEKTKKVAAQIKKTGAEALTKLDTSVRGLMSQVKNSKVSLQSITATLQQLDKEAAKQKAKQEVSKLRGRGLEEAQKLRVKIEAELKQLNSRVSDAQKQLKTETQKARSKAEDSIKKIRAEIKSMTARERAKRDGGS